MLFRSKDDGSVVTWGHESRGGDSTSVTTALSSGVSDICSTGYGFAALKGYDYPRDP